MKNAQNTTKNAQQKQNAQKRAQKNAEAKQSAQQSADVIADAKTIAERAKNVTVDELNAMQSAERVAYTDVEKINLLCCAEIKRAIDSDKYIARYHASFAKAKSDKCDYLHIVSTSAQNVTLLQIKFDSAFKCHINATRAEMYTTEEMKKRFLEADFHFTKHYRTYVISYEHAVECAKKALAILNSTEA